MGAMSLRAILDDRQAVATGDGANRRHVMHQPEQMRHDDGVYAAGRRRVGEELDIHKVIRLGDIDEDRRSADEA